MCRNRVRKTKAHLKFNLVRSAKGFFRYIIRERKTREGVGSWWNGVGDLVTKDVEQAVFSAAISLVFTARVLPSGMPGPQRLAGKS